jgi:hypothetical protein
MKLAIIGSRNFSDENLLNEVIGNHFCDHDPFGFINYGYKASFDELVSGGAVGADTLAEKWVDKYNDSLADYRDVYKIKKTIYPTDLNLPGKRFVGNKEIIENCDEVLVFWNGLSRGTAYNLSIAEKLKKNTTIIYF